MEEKTMSRAEKIAEEKKLLRRKKPEGVNFKWIPATEDEPEKLLATFQGPKGSLFEDETIDIEIKFQDTYPSQPPIVRMLTKVFHPNFLGEVICINCLRGGFFPGITIPQIIDEIQDALANPNPDDFLDREAADLMKEDREQFNLLVHQQIMKNREERNQE